MDINQIREIFNKCQASHQHNQYLKKLIKLEKKFNFNTFYEELTRNVKVVLSSDPKSTYTRNLIDFINIYLMNCSQCKQGENVPPNSNSMTLFEQLIRQIVLTLLYSPRVEFRINCCVLIRKLFNELEDIEENLYNDLKAALIDRCVDRICLVRSNAALALHRFQEPDNNRCMAINALRFHLKNDPDADMRAACVQVLEPCSNDLEDFIYSTLDIKDSVRKIAFTKIADKISVKSFTMEQRNKILKNGFNDKNAFVKDIVMTRLLPNWLKSCNEDLIELLQMLDIQSDTSLIEKIINYYFEELFNDKIDRQTGKTKFHEYFNYFSNNHLDKHRRITKLPLSMENVIVWRMVAEFCHKNKVTLRVDNVDDDISKIEDLLCGQLTPEETHEIDLIDFALPDLSHFCLYINKFFENISTRNFSDVDFSEFRFIFWELIKLCLIIDVGDEAQEKILTTTMKTFLKSNISNQKFNDFIKPIVKCLGEKVFKNEKLLLDFTVEVISEIYLTACEHSSLNDSVSVEEEKRNELEYAKLVLKLNELRDQLDNAVAKENFLEAQNYKNQIDQVKQRMDEIKQKRIQDESFSSSQLDLVNIVEYPDTMLRCLHILCACLECGNFKEVNSVMQTHIEKLCLPGIANVDEKTRNIALRCLGNVCFISQEYTRQYLALFIKVLSLDKESVQIVALQSIFDVLCQHGLNIFDNKITDDKKLSDKNSDQMMPSNEQINEELSEKVSNLNVEKDDNEMSDENYVNLLIQYFEDQFDSPSEEIRHVTAQGIGKLLILGKLYSIRLLSKLILLWHNPKESKKVIHFIGEFLRIYAYAEAQGVILGQSALEEAFNTCLEQIYNEKIHYLNVDNVIKFFLNLISDQSQTRLAIHFANKILTSQNNDLTLINDYYLTALSQLSLVEMESNDLNKFETLCKDIEHKFGNSKVSMKLLTSLKNKIGQVRENLKANATFEHDFEPIDILDKNSNESDMLDKSNSSESHQCDQIQDNTCLSDEIDTEKIDENVNKISYKRKHSDCVRQDTQSNIDNDNEIDSQSVSETKKCRKEI